MCLEKSPQECKLVITTITVELHHYKPSGFFFFFFKAKSPRKTYPNTRGTTYSGLVFRSGGTDFAHKKIYIFRFFTHIHSCAHNKYLYTYGEKFIVGLFRF